MAAAWARRAFSLGAPLIAAVAVAVAVAGRGCEEEAGSPEITVRQFLEATRRLDREAMLELLGPRTRARLGAAALRATDLSSRRYAAGDMLGFNTGLDDLALEELETREVARSEDRASVEIVDRRGRRHRIELVHVEGAWRIELTDP
jgi:hypothetical protein